VMARGLVALWRIYAYMVPPLVGVDVKKVLQWPGKWCRGWSWLFFEGGEGEEMC
jgi:hypothetical protein